MTKFAENNIYCVELDEDYEYVKKNPQNDWNLDTILGTND